MEVTRSAQWTEDNGESGRGVAGGWVLRRNKVNGIQQRQEVKGLLAARRWEGRTEIGMENNKEQEMVV